MKYPNAYQGVKKIFTAEILSLIGSVCMIVVAIFAIVSLASIAASSGDGLLVGGAGALVFGIAGFVLMLISLILLMVGTKRASKDEGLFNKAFLFILFSLILTFVASIVSSTTGATSIWDNLVLTISNIFSMVATVYIINGVQNLAKQLNRPDMVSKGNTYLTLLIVIYVIQIIVNVIPVFFGANAATSTVAGILQLVASILTLIIYFLYLIFLGKAKKMLKEN